MNKVQLAVLQACVDLKEEANISDAFYHVAKQLHTIPTIGAINVARSAASDQNRQRIFDHLVEIINAF